MAELDIGLNTANKSNGRYLYGPIIDFLGLGGLSLIAFILLLPVANIEINDFYVFIGLTIIVSSFVNYPHFASSYQIFYRDFRRKIGHQTPSYLRWRYWVAGVVVPVAMLVYFPFAYVNMNAEMLGYGINLMSFLVGWHYVKQAYGMLSVDAVLKKKFFTDGEKKVLIWHAYAAWMFMWVNGNNLVAEQDYFGLGYYAIILPGWLQSLTTIILAIFAAALSYIFVQRMRPHGKGLPFNGVMAYLTTIYIWLIVKINPLFVIFIPAFHSLQYLTVVGRFQHNLEKAKENAGPTLILSRFINSGAKARVLKFFLIAMLLGVFAFLVIPLSLSANAEFDRNVFGPFLPAVPIFLFINIHHYFLDNVMWRKGNPDVGKHLFAQN